jgi:hypothetical protein
VEDEKRWTPIGDSKVWYIATGEKGRRYQIGKDRKTLFQQVKEGDVKECFEKQEKDIQEKNEK